MKSDWCKVAAYGTFIDLLLNISFPLNDCFSVPYLTSCIIFLESRFSFNCHSLCSNVSWVIGDIPAYMYNYIYLVTLTWSNSYNPLKTLLWNSIQIDAKLVYQFSAPLHLKLLFLFWSAVNQSSCSATSQRNFGSSSSRTALRNSVLLPCENVSGSLLYSFTLRHWHMSI